MTWPTEPTFVVLLLLFRFFMSISRRREISTFWVATSAPNLFQTKPNWRAWLPAQAGAGWVESALRCWERSADIRFNFSEVLHEIVTLFDPKPPFQLLRNCQQTMQKAQFPSNIEFIQGQGIPSKCRSCSDNNFLVRCISIAWVGFRYAEHLYSFVNFVYLLSLCKIEYHVIPLVTAERHKLCNLLALYKSVCTTCVKWFSDLGK